MAKFMVRGDVEGDYFLFPLLFVCLMVLFVYIICALCSISSIVIIFSLSPSRKEKKLVLSLWI